MEKLLDNLKTLDTIDWAEAISRLHPVLLHLPIGLFLSLLWLQVWRLFKGRDTEAGPVRAGLVFLLVLSAPCTAVSGWLLHEGGNYPDPMDLHELCGISLAIVALAIGWAHVRRPALYTPLLWFGVLLMLPTAHFGGTLTYGEGFVTDPWLKQAPPETSKPDSDPKLLSEAGSASDTKHAPATAKVAAPAAPQFADVLPIFEELCLRCHGLKKQRGDLMLSNMDALLLGGVSGPVIVAGKPEASLMMINLLLPKEEEEHMPPPKKAQPTAEELQLIEAWIRGMDPGEGADVSEVAVAHVDPVLAESGPSSEQAQPETERESGPEAEVVENAQPAADPELVALALLQLGERLVHVQPLAENSAALWIDFTATALEVGELSVLLHPLRENIADLCLSAKQLDESDLHFLGGLPALEQLDLRGLPQQALDLAPLAASESIRVLKLAGTPVAEGGLDVLAQMAQLEAVFLWGTGLEDSLASLRDKRPELRIVAEVLPRDPLEIEPEVLFERLPEAVSSFGKVVNENCPVTGKPVDPRYVVLFEERAIGFCCPNCPKTFWEDSAKFTAQLEK